MAPYSLLVVASTFVVPFVIDAGSNLTFNWQVPFAPQTQYQICMFDKNGVTGGCQRMYTVIEGSSNCPNISYPGQLNATAVDSVGALSQFGWEEQCTDIAVTPNEGTPPYTLSMLPTLHPPLNITSSTRSTMNLTVNLSWASPFFILITDSAGKAWSQGPLHAGGPGSSSCLSDGFPSKSSAGVVAGAAIGTLVSGGLIAFLAGYFFDRWRRRDGKHKKLEEKDLVPDPMPSTPGLSSSASDPNSSSAWISRTTDSSPNVNRFTAATSNSSLFARLTSVGPRYEVQPFVMPAGRKTDPFEPIRRRGDSDATRTREGYDHGHQSDGEPSSPSSEAGAELRSPQRADAAGQVYVVHHDGGRAPVTVYMPGGTQVVELPPHYREGLSTVGEQTTPSTDAQQTPSEPSSPLVPLRKTDSLSPGPSLPSSPSET